MSVQAITWAYGLRGLTSGQKFVLVTLCNRADEDWSCYPSVQRISEETGISERSVRDHLLALETAGAIKRDRTRNSDGTLGRYRYFVQRQFQPLAKSAAGREPSKIKAEALPVANPASGEKPLQPAAKSAGQENRQLEPKDNPIAPSISEAFDGLWAAWPAKGRERSKAKAKVCAAFAKVCEKHEPDHVITAAKLWLRTIKPEFAPALDRWLRDGRYEHHLPAGNVQRIGSATNWREAVGEWLRSGNWPHDLGAAPDKPGYSGPRDVVLELIAGAPQDHAVIKAIRKNLQPREDLFAS